MSYLLSVPTVSLYYTGVTMLSYSKYWLLMEHNCPFFHRNVCRSASAEKWRTSSLCPSPQSPSISHISNSQSPHALGYERSVALPQVRQFWTMLYTPELPQCAIKYDFTWDLIFAQVLTLQVLTPQYIASFCLFQSFQL